MDKKSHFAVNPKYAGYLEGHNGAITSIVTGRSNVDGNEGEILITGSRDKNLIIWKVAGEMDRLDGTAFGEPYLSLTGHNHFVSDLSLSEDQKSQKRSQT